MPPRGGSQSPGRSGAGGEYEALVAGATTLVQLRALSTQYVARQREEASARLEQARAETARHKAEVDHAREEAEQLRRSLRAVAVEIEARASRLAHSDLEELRAAVFRGLGLLPDAALGAALLSPALTRSSVECSDKENSATSHPRSGELAEKPKLRARVDQPERSQRRLQGEHQGLRTRCVAAERALKEHGFDRTHGCIEASQARRSPRSPPSSRATAMPVRSPKRSQVSASSPALGAGSGRPARRSAPAAPAQVDVCAAAVGKPADAGSGLLSASAKGVGYARSCDTTVTLITMQDILEGARVGSCRAAATDLASAEPGSAVYTDKEEAPARPAWAADAVPLYAGAR